MDEQRFDDLARLVAQKTSRRQALKLLAGAALGGMFANRLSPALAAGAGRCAKYCNQVFGKDTAATTQCIQDAKRGTGLCYSACGPGGTGGTVCGGTCIDTTSDSNNCGACGNACPTGQTCANGTCTATCQILSSTCAGTATITTANGTTTCVKTCTTDADCLGGHCTGDADGLHSYCNNANCGGCNTFYCTSDADCDPGKYCSNYTSGFQPHTCTNATC